MRLRQLSTEVPQAGTAIGNLSRKFQIPDLNSSPEQASGHIMELMVLPKAQMNISKEMGMKYVSEKKNI